MLILDFDGTVTDAEREGAPFREGYLEDLSVLCGQSLDAVKELAARAERAIHDDPDNHGWVYGGHIVAPATVDPYLRMMPVARAIFDHFRVFPDDTDRSRLLDGILYKYNYQKTLVAFRDGAFPLLSALVDTPSWVVTNSHTEPVQAKIRTLESERGMLDWWLPRVRGRARKYIIDDDFDAIPPTLTVPGLSRPVLLRRRFYYEVIEELLAEAGQRWDDLWVIGDIFELDLAMPLAMGAQVALVVSDFTPRYEVDFVDQHTRGHLVTDLTAIPALTGAA